MSPLRFLPHFLATLLFITSNAIASEEFITKDGPVRVSNWTYQLQGNAGSNWELKPQDIAAAKHDLAVIDYSRDGTEPGKFTPTEVSQMQYSHEQWGGNGRRKVVLSYISIGEASDFRYYWDPAWTTNGYAWGDLTEDAPDWLGPIDQDWPESRRVRYWDPDWQDIIFNNEQTGWLDQIVEQGFDGAYLDIVDVYYFWYEYGERTEFEAAQDMIDFVVALSAHARQTNPDFLIWPQNAEAILDAVKYDDPTRYAAYLTAIDGIGVEDLYFYGNNDENNNFNPQHYIINLLKVDFLAHGRPAFVVDYVNQQTKIDKLYTEALDDGFYPFAAPKRDLDRTAEVGPTPPVMNLTVDNLTGGQTAHFESTNGQPNTQTYLVYSRNGTAWPYVEQIDITLWLNQPRLAGTPTTSDTNGKATWNIPVPQQATGLTVYLQSAQEGTNSDVVVRVVE